MAVNNAILARAAMQLKETLDDTAKSWIPTEFTSQVIVDIVKTHAMGAAAAGLGAAVLPAVGAAASSAVAVGFIWSMYYRINKAIGLSISKTLLKSLASAVLSNIVQAAIAVVGTVLISTALSLTGVGAGVSSLLMAALDYAVVLVGGIIYINLLTKLFAAGKNPSSMSASELKVAARSVMDEKDIKSMLKEAKAEYKRGVKDGTITGKENVELEKE